MLDFLLKAQADISQMQQNLVQLDAIRKAAETRAKAFPAKKFLGDVTRTSGFKTTSIFTSEPEFRKLLLKSDPMDALPFSGFLDTNINSNADVCSVFLAPGYWQAERWNPHEHPEFEEFVTRFVESRFFFRFGFLSSEFEIYESVALGFRGLGLFVRTLDHFQIQYFTEVCKDLHTSVIFWVDSEESLEKVLQTDAPYVGVWGFQPRDFQPQWNLFGRILPRLPRSCLAFAALPKPEPFQLEVLKKQKVRLVFS